MLLPLRVLPELPLYGQILQLPHLGQGHRHWDGGLDTEDEACYCQQCIVCVLLIVPSGIDRVTEDVIGQGLPGVRRPTVASKLPGGGEGAGLRVVAHSLQRAELKLGGGTEPLRAPKSCPGNV